MQIGLNEKVELRMQPVKEAGKTKMNHWKFLLLWIMTILFCMILFTFLHECGHGFGARLEGTHISTSFNRTGDVGKKPSDPDFHSNQFATGTTDSSSLLGPFVNWTFAVIFTALLITVKKNSPRKTFLIGTCAVSNAILRFLPMLDFFLSAPFHHVHLEDEVEWGAASISSIHFPMPDTAFASMAKMHPMLFLSNPLFYFWPFVSIAIVTVCLVTAYRELNRQFTAYIAGKILKVIFILAPVLAAPVWFVVINALDNAFRLNW